MYIDYNNKQLLKLVVLILKIKLFWFRIITGTDNTTRENLIRLS